MVWNEPGGSRGRDPWGNQSNDKGPPDLDEAIRKLQEKFRKLFKGKSEKEEDRDDNGTQGTSSTGAPFFWILIALGVFGFLVWESAYIIEPPERGVVLRFGSYASTLSPGLNLRLPPPIEAVEIINIDQIRSWEHKATMLTQDENIVDIELAVQYLIKDPKDYLFNVFRPDAVLAQATESAVRSVIGKSKLDFVLTEGRAEIASGIESLIQSILDQYKTGLRVTSVNMQPAKPPDEVKGAFDDAIKAREDEQRQINEAEAYKNEIIPKARGAAARIKEDAIAYKARVVAQAEGDAKRFEQLRAQYEKAPEVTRRRLYLETMESVLSTSTKVLMDTQGGNNMVYLPLDKIMERAASTASPSETKTLPPLIAPSAPASAIEATPVAPSTGPVDDLHSFQQQDSNYRDRSGSRMRGSR